MRKAGTVRGPFLNGAAKMIGFKCIAAALPCSWGSVIKPGGRRLAPTKWSHQAARVETKLKLQIRSVHFTEPAPPSASHECPQAAITEILCSSSIAIEKSFNSGWNSCTNPSKQYKLNHTSRLSRTLSCDLQLNCRAHLWSSPESVGLHCKPLLT